MYQVKRFPEFIYYILILDDFIRDIGMTIFKESIYFTKQLGVIIFYLVVINLKCWVGNVGRYTLLKV